MSKLIVEMWMPSRCPCVLAVDNNGWFSPCFAENGIPSRTKDFDDCIENGTRPSWCPIKGELPDEHGDLIDRDAMKQDAKFYCEMDCTTDVCYECEFKYIDEFIDRQPVIIAAERKDDGTTAD